MKFFIISIIGIVCIISISITAIPTMYKFFPESAIIENIGVRTGKLEFWDVMGVKDSSPYNYYLIDNGKGKGNYDRLHHFGPIARIGDIFVGDRIVRAGSDYYVIEGGAR